ncbi:hypothetical protein [Bacteroides oleiciplenus]|uniref:Uncharacterized protein n=2 Tax=Bacteroides oleiciplenus TaxID=626931 RepID=K9DX74_9BACE|nr:hypothetical protein [Bacteroides oleiciplenus]EKU89063.1 hypothetical protein HMPREF9447_03937 [Bacteroides oleiciplenus YIT 12058]
MKYIYCILFGALLMLGFHYTPEQKVQELRPETEVVAVVMQSCTRLNQSASVTASEQSYKGGHSFDNEVSDYEISDGLLGDLFSFRNTTAPSKTLRFNTATTMQMLCLADTQLPENKWKGLSPDTNYIKYSNGYYLYTLGHLLI